MFLPYDVLLAVRLGNETGDVSGAVEKVARMDHEAESLLRTILEKLFYLAVLTNVLMGILSFVMMKIVPVFAKMFDEFGLDLPWPTQLLIHVSKWIADYWFLVAPLILPLNAILLIGGLYYVYLLPRDIPMLNRVSLRWDSALIMRSLGLAVRQQRPFLNMIRILSDRYPRRSVRKRLRQTLTHMNNGTSWTDALYQTALLRSVDAAVLSAAQRSGNLEWAVEMAESSAPAHYVSAARAAESRLSLLVLGLWLGDCVCRSELVPTLGGLDPRIDMMRRVPKRSGSMYVETAIGVTLAAIMLIGVAQLVGLEVKQRHEARAMSAATQTAANILERLMALPFAELNPEAVERLQLSNHLTALLDDPQLVVTIDAASDAVTTKRITVQIAWINRAGLRVEPIRLTAWRHSAEATP